jgi:hypothetical protein
MEREENGSLAKKLYGTVADYHGAQIYEVLEDKAPLAQSFLY